MIRAFLFLVALCIVALVSGAPVWMIYTGACAAFVVVLVEEPKK